MRLHRFYVNEEIERTKTVIKDEQLVHQWRDVFRYNVGSEVIIFDGSGMEYDAVIEKLNNREAELRLVSEKKGIMPGKNPSTGSTGSPQASSGQEITLYQSLIKKDKMEWVVEKATELGVSKIVPIISERSEKKNLNLERVRKIVVEASEQCGRANVPEIWEVVSLEEALKNCENAIVFDPSGTTLPPVSLFAKDEREIQIFVGPEGGWTEKELEIFKEAKLKIFSLGNLTLRAETAAIVALGVLGLQSSKG